MDRHFLPVLCFLIVCFELICAKDSDPKVQIYTRDPGHYGKPNILICHASGFYPPELELKLLHDGEEFTNATQTDLAFEENWFYHLTKHAHFEPVKGHQYTCVVTHRGQTKRYHLEPDM